MRVFSIEKINDTPRDFINLFKLKNQITNCSDHIKIDLNNCTFLRPNAVAFIAALFDHVNNGDYTCIIDWENTPIKVLTNLQQNGFCYHINKSIEPWNGNSIKLRRDFVNDENYDGIIDYLKTHCLAGGHLKISKNNKNEIATNLLEVYINSSEHGKLNKSIYTCGQFFPGLNYLKLTILDFGIGIPENVLNYVKNNKNSSLTDSQAISIAFRPGFTTKEDTFGGNGLPNLFKFVKKYAGTLDVYSGSGYVKGTNSGLELYRYRDYFKGTIVQLTLKCDIMYQ